jgi:hypothetical protein
MSVTVLLSDFSNQPFLGSACENRQFYRRQQPLSYERSPEGDHDTKGQGNKEFAKWLRDWVAAIQQNRASAKDPAPDKTPRTDAHEHSDGAHDLRSA